MDESRLTVARRPFRRHTSRLFLLLLIGGLPAWGAEAPAGEDPPQKDKEEAAEEEKAPARTDVADSVTAEVKKYVKETLQPTTLEFRDDGSVVMTFDFSEKKDCHSEIFNVPVGTRMQDAFRWTTRDEEWVIGGQVGLRVSNRGLALLNCWFQEPIEAEMEFSQYINHDSRHVAAVVFVDDKGQGYGSNYGTQCVALRRGRIAKASGKPKPVGFDVVAKIKLGIKEGFVETCRDGRESSKIKCSRKSLPSGKIGFLWGGSLSGIVRKVAITGKIDCEKTAAEMKKLKKSRSR